MRTADCSKEAPWGIHLSLLGEHCPRCGWKAPKPKPDLQVEPELGWVLLTASQSGLAARQ